MRNSRKQSYHFEFSSLLMGWVIWKRQYGSKAKEPTGIKRAKVWLSVTAAALATPGRKLPFPGPQILPMNTRINSTKPSPRDVKPGLPYVVLQTMQCTRVPTERVSGCWNVAHTLLINLCILVMDRVCLEKGTLYSNLHKVVYGLVGALCEARW